MGHSLRIFGTTTNRPIQPPEVTRQLIVPLNRTHTPCNPRRRPLTPKRARVVECVHSVPLSTLLRCHPMCRPCLGAASEFRIYHLCGTAFRASDLITP